MESELSRLRMNVGGSVSSGFKPIGGEDRESGKHESEGEEKKKDKTLMTRAEYEELQEESGMIWTSLPDSVIGTLIYFLLIEQNDTKFKVWECLKTLGLIGFPVYYTYYLQFTILLELERSLPALGDRENSGLCVNDISIELAAAAIFFIFVFPNLMTIISEAAIVLRCTEAAYLGEEEKDEIHLLEIKAPIMKRVFVWLTVSFAEICLLITLFVVGTQFILTSQGIANIVLNSVAIVFVMDIDNFAREAFQSEAISEHVDSMQFNTLISAGNEEMSEGRSRDLSMEQLTTFWSIEKAAVVIMLTCVLVYCLQGFYC